MTDPYTDHRSLLFTVAYEMLGSAADAEDVVQETWLRWAKRDTTDEVRDPRAYLVRIVTRLALNRLRTLARRREDYVGEWLPEPLLTGPDVAEDVELAESVSMAMLTVLETLTPTERAVFVLREVFDMPYEEIARAVDKSSAAVRQIARRSRDHVAARRPRVSVSATEQKQVVERFLEAVRGGDLGALMDTLAPDVVVVADGGGVVEAAFRPITGVNKIRQLFALLFDTYPGITVTPLWINGARGARYEVDGRVTGVTGLVVEGGRITKIYAVANPHKLTRVDAEVPLSRLFGLRSGGEDRRYAEWTYVRAALIVARRPHARRGRGRRYRIAGGLWCPRGRDGAAADRRKVEGVHCRDAAESRGRSGGRGPGGRVCRGRLDRRSR